MNRLGLHIIQAMPEIIGIIADTVIGAGKFSTATKRERAKALAIALPKLVPMRFSRHQLEAFIDEINRLPAGDKQRIRNGLASRLILRFASSWMQMIARLPGGAEAIREELAA